MLWPVVKEEQIRWQRIGMRWQRIRTMFLSKYQKNVLSLYKIGCTRQNIQASLMFFALVGTIFVKDRLHLLVLSFLEIENKKKRIWVC